MPNPGFRASCRSQKRGQQLVLPSKVWMGRDSCVLAGLERRRLDHIPILGRVSPFRHCRCRLECFNFLVQQGAIECQLRSSPLEAPSEGSLEEPNNAAIRMGDKHRERSSSCLGAVIIPLIQGWQIVVDCGCQTRNDVQQTS